MNDILARLNLASLASLAATCVAMRSAAHCTRVVSVDLVAAERWGQAPLAFLSRLRAEELRLLNTSLDMYNTDGRLFLAASKVLPAMLGALPAVKRLVGALPVECCEGEDMSAFNALSRIAPPLEAPGVVVIVSEAPRNVAAALSRTAGLPYRIRVHLHYNSRQPQWPEADTRACATAIRADARVVAVTGYAPECLATLCEGGLPPHVECVDSDMHVETVAALAASPPSNLRELRVCTGRSQVPVDMGAAIASLCRSAPALQRVHVKPQWGTPPSGWVVHSRTWWVRANA